MAIDVCLVINSYYYICFDTIRPRLFGGMSSSHRPYPFVPNGFDFTSRCGTFWNLSGSHLSVSYTSKRQGRHNQASYSSEAHPAVGAIHTSYATTCATT